MTVPTAPDTCDFTPTITPIEKRGGILLKRDDEFRIAGIRGGKVRSCWHLMTAPSKPAGVVTAGARQSPQMQIVARLAQRLGLPARCHTAHGAATPEMHDAKDHGAEVILWKPGYNSVICARAEADAAEHPTWRYIPFGMECREAVQCTRAQVAALEPYKQDIKRIVVVVGSGMTLCGLLWGLNDLNWDVPVIGVQIGASPLTRLDKWGPPMWRMRWTSILKSRHSYSNAVHTDIHGLKLDPHYEGKCVEHLQDGDLFWIVGIRAGA